MFETKVSITKEADFATFLGGGRETCQNAALDLLGESLSHMQHAAHLLCTLNFVYDIVD